MEGCHLETDTGQSWVCSAADSAAGFAEISDRSIKRGTDVPIP